MITWIMSSRDDGFGGSCDGVDNFCMKRLEICIGSILSLNTDPEIIVVDFCPLPDRPLSKYIGHLPVKIITIKRQLLPLLQEDCPEPKMNFYEYVPKHIAVKYAKGDDLIFCNPDNIFPKTNFDAVIDDLSKGYIVKAVRLDIAREYAQETILRLVLMANNDQFPITKKFTTAAGDFMGISKKTYQDIGGFALMHGDWHIDNDILNRLRFNGFETSTPYSHYHIWHEGTIYAPLKNHDFDNFKPINPKILERADEFIQI